MTENAVGNDECVIRLDIGCQVAKNKVTCTNGKVTSPLSKWQRRGGTGVGEAKKIGLKRTWGDDVGVWSRDRTAVKPCMWIMKWIRASPSKPLSEHTCSGIIVSSYQIRLSGTQNRQATLKRVAGRSEVGAIGLELITRRW